MKGDQLIGEYIEKQSKELSDRELLEEIYNESKSFRHKRLMEKMMGWTMMFAVISLFILLLDFPPFWSR